MRTKGDLRCMSRYHFHHFGGISSSSWAGCSNCAKASSEIGILKSSFRSFCVSRALQIEMVFCFGERV
jgi:hypothetical protein